ncbi:putative odorant receptor 69a [Periplaneta americana]|uniref:putative odorant receptor 69a n=1 Tax=Periplaneta americana TaxID=6978 RepID=UPI0037E8C7E2
MRAGATFYTAPYFYAKLICIACVQLEKVRGSLLSIKQENEIGKKYTSINIGKSENRAHEINDHLKYLICHHNQTLSYINNLQEFFSMLMCGILFLFMISLCASAFSVMMTLNDTVDASQGAVMYLAVVVMAYFYCNFGTMLAREYEAVGDAAFASDWIGAPVPYQRSLSFIILVANKGKTLVAGHIVPITNETLMAMINESMSLFMFLLTMKEKSDENM